MKFRVKSSRVIDRRRRDERSHPVILVILAIFHSCYSRNSCVTDGRRSSLGCVRWKKGPYCFDVFGSRDQYMISFSASPSSRTKCSSGGIHRTCLTGRGGGCHIPPSRDPLPYRGNSATNPWWPSAGTHSRQTIRHLKPPRTPQGISWERASYERRKCIHERHPGKSLRHMRAHFVHQVHAKIFKPSAFGLRRSANRLFR